MFGEGTLGFYASKNMVKKVCKHMGCINHNMHAILVNLSDPARIQGLTEI